MNNQHRYSTNGVPFKPARAGLWIGLLSTALLAFAPVTAATRQAGHEMGKMMEHCKKVMQQRQSILAELQQVTRSSLNY
ncbi:MAG: hypothetical protein Kow00109_13940 [Acidobacteriota bacterium]